MKLLCIFLFCWFVSAELLWRNPRPSSVQCVFPETFNWFFGGKCGYLSYLQAIFSSAWLCQQSSWNRNLSLIRRLSIRPSSFRVAIISEPNIRIPFKFSAVASPVPYAEAVFFFLFFYEYFTNIFFYLFYEYFSFSLTWDPMGAKISKRYSSYKSQPKVFKRILNFLPNGPHKTTFGNLFKKIEILTNFIRFRWHGTQWEVKIKNAPPPPTSRS